MDADIDELVARLADQPIPASLGSLETNVFNQLAQHSARMAAAPTWRLAAVGVALIIGVGIGVGGTAPTIAGVAHGSAILAAGVDLAPSSLLTAS